MKSGIVVDDYKLKYFLSKLDRYIKLSKPKPFTPGVSVLVVFYEQHQLDDLTKIIKDCEAHFNKIKSQKN